MSYIINIPNPCHEDWNKMIPTADGRYCDVCKKNIYDFTNLSNRDLVEKLEQGQNICAKYRKSQLNTNLYTNSNNRFTITAIFLSITSSVFLTSNVVAQNENEPPKMEQQLIKKDVEKALPHSQLDTIVISGIVNDEYRSPLPQAKVTIKGTDIQTLTDFDGKFSFVLTDVELPLYIEVIYYDYDYNEVKITKLESNIHLDIYITETFLGEVVFVKRSFLKRVGDFFRFRKNK